MMSRLIIISEWCRIMKEIKNVLSPLNLNWILIVLMHKRTVLRSRAYVSRVLNDSVCFCFVYSIYHIYFGDSFSDQNCTCLVTKTMDLELGCESRTQSKSMNCKQPHTLNVFELEYWSILRIWNGVNNMVVCTMFMTKVGAI